MATTNIFAGHDQTDTAAFRHSNGFFYRLIIYRVNRGAAGDNTSNELRASCFVEQDQGQEVLLFEVPVRSYEDSDGEIVFPKVLVSGDRFVVHWCEGPLEFGDLHRASINPMPTVAGAVFEYHGATNIDGSCLYDAVPITGGATTDYVVARKINDTTINVTRFDGYDWVDTDWIDVFATTIADHCLGAVADTDLGAVVASWERAGPQVSELWSASWDISDGSGAVQVRSFTTGVASSAVYTNVGLTKVHRSATGASTQVFLDVEFRPTVVNGFAENQLRGIAWVLLSGTTAAPQSEEQSVWNCNMVSRPWSVRGTSASGSEI
jgi:hypothetical protein